MQEEIRVVLNNDKTPSEFSSKLFKPLMLDESWKVALTEIAFSNSPNNFSPEDFLICKNFETKTDQVIRLNSDTIANGKKLIDFINNRLVEIKEQPGIQFQFDELSHKTTLTLQASRGIHLSKRLSHVLSLKEIVENKNKKKELMAFSNYCTDVRLHFWNIYIYSNLTKPIILGEKLYPVLQTLPVESFHENYMIKSFNPPMFMPLSTHFIPEIEIKICDELGRNLEFKSGCSTLCKLLFKRNR